MGIVIGQEVFTVNAKTNTVDSWKYLGAFPTSKELLFRLGNGKKICHLPARCVYYTREEALKVAKK